MPRQRKRVLVKCYGPVGAGPHHTSPWEDVWLQWQGKPGRRRFEAAPTLVCKPELLADLHGYQLNDDDPVNADDVAHCKAMLNALEHAGLAIDDLEYPNVYTCATGIDRAEAERMITFFLEQRHGVSHPKFAWRKVKFLLTPVGAGGYSTRRRSKGRSPRLA